MLDFSPRAALQTTVVPFRLKIEDGDFKVSRSFNLEPGSKREIEPPLRPHFDNARRSFLRRPPNLDRVFLGYASLRNEVLFVSHFF